MKISWGWLLVISFLLLGWNGLVGCKYADQINGISGNEVVTGSRNTPITSDSVEERWVPLRP